MVGFNNLESMKQIFSVLEMTPTYRASERDPLGLKYQMESFCSF